MHVLGLLQQALVHIIIITIMLHIHRINVSFEEKVSYRQLNTFSDLLAADTFTCINLSRVCTFKAAVFGS